MVLFISKACLHSFFGISCILLFSSLVFTLFCETQAAINLPPNITVPAVIAFGDSIMDTGNNNNLDTLVKCNFPPYGKDFETQLPTGRFCNGKVPSDFLAQELGIKELLPAYLDTNLKSQDLITGVSFASGGSGYDPLTPKIVSVVSLSGQLKMFKEYIGKLKAAVGEDRTAFILANSLFVVVAGSDDIANTYFTARVRQLQYDVPTYASLMASSASSFLKELYEMGARRIGVFSAPPIGCVPSQRTLSGGLLRFCSENDNQAALLFNTKLSAEIDTLNSNLPKSKIVYIDIYNPLLDLIVNPQKHGFKITDRGCCGSGKIEVAILCNQFDTVCTNVADYVFWDSYHPTERAYRSLLSNILPEYVNKFF